MAENDDVMIVFGNNPQLSTVGQVDIREISHIEVYTETNTGDILVSIEYHEGDIQELPFTAAEYNEFREDRPDFRLPELNANGLINHVKYSPSGKSGNTIGKITSMPAVSVGDARAANPAVIPETENEEQSWGENIETALDVAGLIPGLGTISGIGGAAFYALSGDWASAGTSLISAIPIVGNVAKGAKLGGRGYKVYGKLAHVGSGGVNSVPVSANSGSGVLGTLAKPGARAGEKAQINTAVVASGAIVKSISTPGDPDDRCKLKPHDELDCDESQGLTRDRHHVVANRAFQLGTRKENILMSGGVPEPKGLSICLDSNKLGEDAEHIQAHMHYDAQEKVIRFDGKTDDGIGTLGQLEDIAAEAIEKATGGMCKKEDIKKQLREYHQKEFGLEPETLVRASKHPGGIKNVIDQIGKPSQGGK